MAGVTRRPRWVGRVLGALLALCMVLGSGAAFAQDHIEVTQASLDPIDDGWALNAQFEMTLKPRLEEALERGLPLYFVVDFELTQPRWYWFDDRTATDSLTYRLSYYALTREYRLSTGTLQIGFPTLNEALKVLESVRDWRVMDRAAIHPGATYIASVRMRFDTSELPKPFQLNTLTSHEWSMESDWKRFSFEVTR